MRGLNDRVIGKVVESDGTEFVDTSVQKIFQEVEIVESGINSAGEPNSGIKVGDRVLLSGLGTYKPVLDYEGGNYIVFRYHNIEINLSNQ